MKVREIKVCMSKSSKIYRNPRTLHVRDFSLFKEILLKTSEQFRHYYGMLKAIQTKKQYSTIPDTANTAHFKRKACKTRGKKKCCLNSRKKPEQSFSKSPTALFLRQYQACFQSSLISTKINVAGNLQSTVVTT